MNFEDKIKELQIELPEAKAPVGSYVATKMAGNLLYVSGQISMNSKGELIKGKVGKDLTTDEAYKAAERCGLSIVAQVKKACNGDLSKIRSCVKLTGFVNSTEDFTEQPKVINGASNLIAFGLMLFLTNFANSNETKCINFKKFSKEYLKCNADKIKKETIKKAKETK